MTAPIVAVIGGGQLARMMTGPATELGVTLRVLVESPDAAAAASAHQIVVGMPGDADAVAAVLDGADVVTWEHEHIPAAVFEAAAQRGIPAFPSAEALAFAQDKIVMRERMDALGAPNPAWAPVHTHDDLDAFLAAHGGVAVLKTARGGYDGKGVRVVRSAVEADDWIAAAAEGGPRLLVEQKVAFTRELSAQVARTPQGNVVAYPVVESTQRDGICAEVIAPAPGLDPLLAAAAQGLAITIAMELDVVGMLAVELFEVDGSVVVNELAMRPHNSGHWSMDGAVTGQFEQHLRAVLDLPLGDVTPTAPWTVMANVLGGSREHLASALGEVPDSGAKIHLYGKDVRPGRKVGHVTVAGDDLEHTLSRAREAADIVRDGAPRRATATGGEA
ncbi:5-(carboxyamino)imidazole ribonucleotide synthase [Demequina sp.]|uniref:5-(carboxyamino)imidazole ribonucleotide synthase n=1 Tax=Demequina sp. TaxID=2050685 RepID=UPI003D12E13B